MPGAVRIIRRRALLLRAPSVAPWIACAVVPVCAFRRFFAPGTRARVRSFVSATPSVLTLLLSARASRLFYSSLRLRAEHEPPAPRCITPLASRFRFSALRVTPAAPLSRVLPLPRAALLFFRTAARSPRPLFARSTPSKRFCLASVVSGPWVSTSFSSQPPRPARQPRRRPAATRRKTPSPPHTPHPPLFFVSIFALIAGTEPFRSDGHRPPFISSVTAVFLRGHSTNRGRLFYFGIISL
jgi:hypothetical protein